MSDSTIASVANGGSPQPVKVQDPSPTNADQFDDIADDVVDGDEVTAAAPEGDEATAAIDAAEKAGDLSKKEAATLRKKLSLKVDGEEFEEEIDFNDDETLKKHLQKSKAFDKRLKEFSSYKSQVDALIKELQENPEGILEKMGYNVDEMAEKRLARKVEEMTKEEKEIEK